MIGKIGKEKKIEKDKKDLKKENLSKNKETKKGNKNMLKKGIFSLIILLMVGCENNTMGPEIDDRSLVIYSTTELDKNGYYHYPYAGFNYGSIYFETEPMSLVAWTSPDEFCIQFFEELICEPVINYQTYAREDGTGQQNFYMNSESIGDTLTLIGYLNEDIVDEIRVIIK